MWLQSQSTKRSCNSTTLWGNKMYQKSSAMEFSKVPYQQFFRVSPHWCNQWSPLVLACLNRAISLADSLTLFLGGLVTVNYPWPLQGLQFTIMASDILETSMHTYDSILVLFIPGPKDPQALLAGRSRGVCNASGQGSFLVRSSNGWQLLHFDVLSPI